MNNQHVIMDEYEWNGKEVDGMIVGSIQKDNQKDNNTKTIVIIDYLNDRIKIGDTVRNLEEWIHNDMDLVDLMSVSEEEADKQFMEDIIRCILIEEYQLLE